MYDTIDGQHIGYNQKQMTLGELIDKLDEFPLQKLISFVKTEYCVETYYPCGTSSYRGYCDEIAVKYSSSAIDVGTFQRLLRQALYKTFSGYKGGEYKMTLDTPVWAAKDSSNCSNLAIVSVFTTEGGEVIIGTRLKD